jgi:PAS domain S-box-containing protein
MQNELTFLSEAAGALLTADDPRAFLETLCRPLSTLVKLDVYVYYTLSEDGTHLILSASHGVPENSQPTISRLELGQAVCGTVAERRASMAISDVQQRTDMTTAMIRQLGLTAYVCHPLIAQGELLGTVSFGTRRNSAFTEEALVVMEIVSHYLAAAVERRRGEKTLAMRAKQWHALAESMPLFVWTCLPDGRCDYLSRQWVEYTGEGAPEQLGYGWLKHVHPEDRDSLLDQWRQAVARKQVLDTEFRIRGADGQYRWFKTRATPSLDEAGDITRWYGSNTDIQDLKQAELVQAHLAAIVDSSDDAIISKTLDGVINAWNHAAERLYGYTAQEAIGRHISLIIPPERQKEEPLIVERIRQGERIEHYDTVRRKKNGMPLDVSLSVSPIIDRQGRIIGIAKSARDISDRKRTEAALKELTADLEKRVAERTQALRQSRAKLQSLASELTVTEERERRRIAEELHDHLAQLLVVSRMKLSHAIRQTAANSSLSAQLQDLDQVIDEALKYTRSLVVQLTPPVLHELGFQPALQWLSSWMDQQGLKVSLRLAHQPVRLSGDQAILLYQSVRELLMNVLKHAGTGRAVVSVGEDHGGLLRVSVTDEGRGFDVNEADNTEPGHFGLFSIKERIEGLYGRVEIRSSPGQGTCVTLLVPIPAVAEASPDDQALKTTSNGDGEPHRLRILLVDDHAMVREGLRSILESYADLEVVGEAGDGMEAVKLARTRHPDVVVMDINMPRMDGIAATRQIKQDHPSTAVIGISVQDSAQVEQAMLSAGASKFLTKDRAAGHLYEAILQTR